MTNPEFVNRSAEYFLQSDDGTFIYISTPETGFDEKDIKFFIGNGQLMKRIAVQSARRYGDDKTTYVVTDEGTFFSPAQPEQPSSWTGSPDLYELTKVDTDEYNIVETDQGVTITKK